MSDSSSILSSMFPTRIQRITRSQIGSSSLFFRTSRASRTAPRFLHEHRILPPLTYSVVVHALRTLQSQTDALSVHFADAEADPFIVELAGRLNGYVIGQDTDFVVLNSPGYLGYIPFDEMSWTSQYAEDGPVTEEHDGFQLARKDKRRALNPRFGHGLIPPELTDALTLSASVYNPSLLARHLKLPVSLLPLVGAFVGNDYGNDVPRRNLQSLIFERRLSPVQRIIYIASTIESILSAANRRQKDRVETVTDLIAKTIYSILPSHLASGQIDDLVDQVAESTLQYAIPKYENSLILPASSLCLLHEICPLLSAFCRKSPDGELDSLASGYLQAYRAGLLSAETVDCLFGTQWPRLFLEHPDIQTVTLIGRPIRQWGYAILHDAIGLPDSTSEGTGSSENILDDSDDEIVDVAEEQSSDEEANTPQDTRSNLLDALMPENRLPQRFTAEYVRRGSRLVDEQVLVPELTELLETIDVHEMRDASLLSDSEEHRLTVFLRIMKSDHSLIKDLPPELLIPVVTLRWVCQWFYTHAQELPDSKDRQLAKWTQHEGRCFLACFEGPLLSDADQGDITLLDRNVQITAQVLHILECVENLAQILWLWKRIPSPLQSFSGKKFHRLLTTKTGFIQPAGSLWQAAIAGIECVFRAAEKSKSKGNKGSHTASRTAKSMKNVSLYKLLEDVTT